MRRRRQFPSELSVRNDQARGARPRARPDPEIVFLDEPTSASIRSRRGVSTNYQTLQLSSGSRCSCHERSGSLMRCDASPPGRRPRGRRGARRKCAFDASGMNAYFKASARIYCA